MRSCHRTSQDRPLPAPIDADGTGRTRTGTSGSQGSGRSLRGHYPNELTLNVGLRVTASRAARLGGVRTKWVGPLLAVGVAMLVVGCGGSPPVSRHTPTPRATATPWPAGSPVATPASTTAPTPASGPVQATLTTADLANMTSVWVSYRESGQPPSFVGYPALPARIDHGRQKLRGTHARRRRVGDCDVRVDRPLGRNSGSTGQHAGRGERRGYFRTSPESTWTLRGLEIGGCGAIPGIGVPSAVAALLGIPDAATKCSRSEFR